MTDVSNSRTNKEIQAVTIRSIEKEKIRANTFYFEKNNREEDNNKKNHQMLMSLRSREKPRQPTIEKPLKVKQSRGQPRFYEIRTVQLPTDLDYYEQTM